MKNTEFMSESSKALEPSFQTMLRHLWQESVYGVSEMLRLGLRLLYLMINKPIYFVTGVQPIICVA